MKGKVVLKSILTTLNTAAYTALEGVNEWRRQGAQQAS